MATHMQKHEVGPFLTLYTKIIKCIVSLNARAKALNVIVDALLPLYVLFPSWNGPTALLPQLTSHSFLLTPPTQEGPVPVAEHSQGIIQPSLQVWGYQGQVLLLAPPLPPKPGAQLKSQYCFLD